jgi:predicted transcriptional regulator
MGSVELDLGGGLKLARFLKSGYTAYFEGRTFNILQGDKVVESFSDSQGRILNQIIQKKAMTPKQISEVVGSTPAGVLYNLKDLIRAGVIERHPLPGGSVFYILCWDVKMDVSPALKAKIQPEVSKMGGWGQMGKIPMGELRKNLSSLSDEEFLEVMRCLVGGATVAG